MKVTKVKYRNRIEWHNEKGKRHRTDGPAVESSSGYKSWYINGERHRTDGPAVESSSGYKEWFLNGIEYSKEDWENEVLRLRLKRLSEL